MVTNVFTSNQGIGKVLVCQGLRGIHRSADYDLNPLFPQKRLRPFSHPAHNGYIGPLFMEPPGQRSGLMSRRGAHFGLFYFSILSFDVCELFTVSEMSGEFSPGNTRAGASLRAAGTHPSGEPLVVLADVPVAAPRRLGGARRLGWATASSNGSPLAGPSGSGHVRPGAPNRSGELAGAGRVVQGPPAGCERSAGTDA